METENKFDAAKVRLPDGQVAFDAVKLAQIETEGVWLRGDNRNIPQRCEIKVRTRNALYILKVDGDFVCGVCEREDGHKNHLPLPVQVHINGSTWGGSMLKMAYLGVDMHMECVIPGEKTFTTTPIESLTVKAL